MILRPYQSQVLDDLWRWFAEHPEGDPIVEACVGAGKSVMIAALCERAIRQHPGTRIVMAVHVKELAEQNLAKLLQVWPGAPVGAYSAALGRREAWRDITFCTIQTVHNKASEFGRVDLLLVDECHLISPKAASMYQRFIAALRVLNPALRVIGWTGTAFRGDGVWLTAHGLFSHIAARVKMADLLAQGYLAPRKAVATAATISAEGVAVRQGDYVVGDLEAAADHADLVQATAAEIVRLAEGRRAWMVFAVTVRHALHVLQAIRAHGVPAAMVTGETPLPERERYIRQFKAGELRCLVNVAVLTTGFDVPAVDCIALLRPTKSPVLYVQIAGRGMRTADGKADCLWLDFTSTTREQGPVDLIKGRVPAPRPAGGRKAPAAQPVKHCPECGNPSGVLALRCGACGHEYPPDLKHGAASDGAQVLGARLAEHEVTRVDYRRHAKAGRPPSLRADYWSGLNLLASEWVCLEHIGYARTKAEQWWRQRGHQPPPASVDEALARLPELIDPLRIATRQAGPHTEIVHHEFDRTEQRAQRAEEAAA
jgi:DNA repair protein RadD